MTRAIEWLERAAVVLGFHVERDYMARLPGGTEVRAEARIPGLGGALGMLVFARYSDVMSSVQGLVDAGYGYTVLDEPLAGEEFDLRSYEEMFVDWGASPGGTTRK